MSRTSICGLNMLPTNWSDREKAYSELSVSLGQVVILQMGVRQGVSSGSDEQVGSTSRSTTAQTNTDTDEMEEVVDEEENVEDPDTRMTQEAGEQGSSPDPSYLPTCCVRVVKTKVKKIKKIP
jgi:hypothetical protein